MIGIKCLKDISDMLSFSQSKKLVKETATVTKNQPNKRSKRKILQNIIQVNGKL